jgi:pyrimidine-nucleoside phosphorylase
MRSMTEAQMRRAIAHKRDGGELDARTYADVTRAALSGEIAEAQAAALLMACVLRGMTFAETYALTEAFVASGETLVADDPRTVDKHSSGGVADTASLVVVPLVAACGVPFAKLSGRALGHTGGTLDKLEAIPGVRTDLAPERFFAIVRDVGCAIAAQGPRLVPADKFFYALRDRTATVPSRGLIAASIVSKKIAGGARAIVYDVKTGGGAFLEREADARELAETLVRLTEAFGRRALALVTDMDEPLGPAIGTGLEAIEARDFLRGTRRDERLAAVCDALGRALLRVAGYDGDAGRALADALASGRAAETFDAMLAAQGAESGALDSLAVAGEPALVVAERDGFVAGLDAVALGECARDLVAAAGAGAGIVLDARTGEHRMRGDVVARVYGGDARATATVANAFAWSAGPTRARPLVYGEIEAGSERAGDGTSTSGGAALPRSTLESK